MRKKDPILEILRGLCDFFDYDIGNINLWLSSKNPLLGNVSPRQMIKFGRHEKLLEIVKYQLSQNRKPQESAESTP